jgi:glycosyltransferase involved in cell wall biosynthesis
MNAPLISIITPSYNRAGMIREAIDSVRAQNYPSIEHIVVDGGSTDGTLDILRSYPHLKIVSGPDQGMYDALNKGLNIASGDIIGFLNTDDHYSPGAFVQVINLLEQSRADAIAAQAAYFSQGPGNTISVFRKSVLLTPRVFWREITYGDPAFNAWFFHRRVFGTLGEFDVTYRIAGDRDFLLRFALSKLIIMPLEEAVYYYRAHEHSLSMTHDLLRFSQVANENLSLVAHYSDSLPLKARAYMQRVRTRDTITAASRNLRGHALSDAVFYAKLGCQYDLLWPMKFLVRILSGIVRTAGRELGIGLPPGGQ